MIVRDCKCVSVSGSLVSKKHNNRSFVLSYWCVQDPSFSNGAYFCHFAWSDQLKQPIRAGATSKCVQVNGEYLLLES